MGSKQKTATQTSTTDIPDWMKTNYVIPALDKAKGMLDDEFTPFEREDIHFCCKGTDRVHFGSDT